jgi:methionyl-tRNA formyltransferase
VKLVFMGTPEFAVPSLERLLESDHDLAAVVTRPDRPRGRGQRVEPTPVKKVAVEAGVPVLQPEHIDAPESLNQLREIGADLFVVVAFVLLPKPVLSIPLQGCVNLHPSLLPRYRGAAPINWAIIRGESETGITVFRLSARMDAGDILHQEPVGIGPDETAGELSDRLKVKGADAVLATVERLASGGLTGRPQQSKGITRAPKLSKDDGRTDWTRSATEIRNLIRGTNPFPGAFTTRKNKELKLHRATVVAGEGTPGQVILADGKAGLVVATGQDALALEEVQPAGKARMTGAELVRGYRVEAGEKLG